MQVRVQVVVTRHRVLLAAFFMQPHPGAQTLHIDIFEAYADGCSHPRKGADLDILPALKDGDSC